MIEVEGTLAEPDSPPAAVHKRIKVSDGFVGTLCAFTDFAVIAICMVAIDLVYHSYIGGGPDSFRKGWSAAVLVSSLFVALQWLQRAYGTDNFLDTPRQLRVLLLGWCVVFFAIGWVGFLLKITDDYSRAVLTISFVAVPVALLAQRIAVSSLLRHGLSRGRLALRKAYLVCAGDATQRDRIIRESAREGVNIVATRMIDPAAVDSGPGGDGSMKHSLLESIRAAFQNDPFNEIYLFVPLEKWRPLNDLTIALNQVPLPVYLFAGEEMGAVLRARPLHVGRFSGFEVQRPPLSSMEFHLKRGLDIVVAATALVALSPLLLLVSLAILAESGRPVIFRQSRKGFGERSFTIFKFRTMTVCENGDTIAQATRNDARVTRLGAVLRRTSIDELPQLMNVLRGEMSIVGPRPHAIAHDHYYDALIATYAYRHHVKPGLTGWAQIHRLRGETRELGSMEERIKYDIWYINNWSIWLDIQIVARTAATLLLHKQAY